MTWTLQYTGARVDFLNPDPEQISIVDIAVGLARESRFNGQLACRYTVAQHSMLAASVAPPEYQLELLLHDATEAYMRDLSTPLKSLLPDYQAIERRLDQAIRRKFGLPQEMSAVAHKIDVRMYNTERRDMKPPHVPWEAWHMLPDVEPFTEFVITPEQDDERLICDFLNLFEALKGRHESVTR